MKYEIALVDDHQLFTMSLEMMVNGFKNFRVTIIAHSGAALQNQIRSMANLPDIMLLDVSMPGMGGAEVARWMTQHYPQVKLAAVTTYDSDKVILDMIKAGCCSYMLKSIHPTELEKALLEIAEKGYYNADATNINFRRLLHIDQQEVSITPREKEFLQRACSDDTYKQIAKLMNVTTSTLEGYRISLFKKLNVENRTGMALEAVRRQIFVL